MIVLNNLKILVQRLYFQTSASDKDIVDAYYGTFGLVLPFNFDGQEFHTCRGREAKFKLFLVFLYSLQTLKLFYTSIQLYLVNNFEHTYIIVCLMCLSITSSSFLLNGIYNGNQFCQTLNSWLALRKGERTAFTETLQPLFVMMFTFGLAFGLLFCTHPGKPYFLFTMTGLGGDSNKIILGVFLVADVLLQTYAFIGINLIIDGVLVGMFSALHDNLEDLRKVDRVGLNEIMKYRTLQTFEIFVNKGTGHIFTVIKVVSYFAITYGVVKAVMSAGDPNLTADLMTAVALLCPMSLRIKDLLCGMARFYTTSVEMLETWKVVVNLQNKERKINVKVMKSFKPLQYSINSMYGMQGHSVLSFVSALVGNIASVLIAYREDYNVAVY